MGTPIIVALVLKMDPNLKSLGFGNARAEGLLDASEYLQAAETRKHASRSVSLGFEDPKSWFGNMHPDPL